MRKTVNQFIGFCIVVGLFIIVGSFVSDLIKPSQRTADENVDKKEVVAGEVSLKDLWHAFNSDNPVYADREYGSKTMKIVGCHVLSINRDSAGVYRLNCRCDGGYRNWIYGQVYVSSDLLAESNIKPYDIISVVGRIDSIAKMHNPGAMPRDKNMAPQIYSVKQIVFERHFEFD